MKIFHVLVLLLVAALPARAEVKIQSVTSPGGLSAWLVEDHSIPFIALELRFRGGAALDAPGKRGATAMMTWLIEDGAGDMDALAFTRATQDLATSFDFDISDDELSISSRFLTENRDASIDLLRLALTDPRFDEDAIERVRRQVLSGIKSDSTDPDVIARRTFNKAVYGDHPYGSSLDGTIESVTALTRDDIVAANKAIIARDRVYVSAVGDITPEELSTLMDRLLGDLPKTGAPMPQEADLNIEGGITVVDFATPQSVAVFGHEGIALQDPDYFAAVLLNFVLGGGGFESRLMTEVREKRGLTYGVYSYLSPRDHAKMFLGSVSSANDRIAEAISVIRDEWAKAASEGLTEQELADAKTYITGAYPLRFDGNSRIAKILVGMQMIGLPVDYIETRNERVEAVTMEDIRRVAGELLDTDALQFVVVGQPEGL